MPWKLLNVEHLSLSINSLWDWFCGIWVPSSTGFWSSLDGLLRTRRTFDIRSNRMSGSLVTKTSPWSNQIKKQINIEQHNYCWFPERSEIDTIAHCLNYNAAFKKSYLGDMTALGCYLLILQAYTPIWRHAHFQRMRSKPNSNFRKL